MHRGARPAVSRHEFSHPTRREALKRSGKRCEAVGERYGLPDGRRCNADLSYGVQFDHTVPDGLKADNSLSNCRAVCKRCHGYKTSKIDVPQIAKMKRQKSKHEGTWPRPVGNAKLQSRGFQSTRWHAVKPRKSFDEELESD